MSGFWCCVVYAVVLALAAHPLGQALPRRFHPERPPFRPWKWEKNGRIYSRLGIEKWKKLVPDIRTTVSGHRIRGLPYVPCQ